jgi:hypothetical protein
MTHRPAEEDIHRPCDLQSPYRLLLVGSKTEEAAEGGRTAAAAAGRHRGTAAVGKDSLPAEGICGRKRRRFSTSALPKGGIYDGEPDVLLLIHLDVLTRKTQNTKMDVEGED